MEDQGYFKIELELPEGATLERTRIVTARAIAYLEQNPYIEYIQNVTGSSPRVGSNQARSEPVSYTHLDVYKRQALMYSQCAPHTVSLIAR